jgi:hypothetical protein
VIDPQSKTVLQDIIRRESRSLLSYVGDAYPWTTAAGGAALNRLRQVVHNETDAVAALGAYVTKQHGELPFLGSYPVSFTSYNFVALNHLLPRLVQTEKELIAALEADVSRLPAGEERSKAEALLAVKRRNLEALQALSAPG